MQTVTEHIRSHLLSSLGICESRRVAPLDELYKTQWSNEFEQLQRNRMAMGAFRYGPLTKQIEYDNVGSAIQRLQRYLQSGNQEHLVDVANLCQVEFVRRTHPLAHWSPSDDGEHTQTKRISIHATK